MSEGNYCIQCGLTYYTDKDILDLRAKLDDAEEEISRVKGEAMAIAGEELILRAKLEMAEKEISEHNRLTELQIMASVRATKMYNEKYGTNIGLNDQAKSELFLMEQNDELSKKTEQLKAQLLVWRRALEQLARLGNGDRYGNSIGNVIAQDALSATPSEAIQKMRWSELSVSQVAVMHEELEKIKDCLEQNIDDPDTVAIELVSKVLQSTKLKAQELERYADLGRLAMRVEVCWHGYKVNDGDCHGEKCSRYKFCVKRDELKGACNERT